MKKEYNKKHHYGLCILLVLLTLNLNAQFEQKITINISGAFLVPELTNSQSIYSPGLGVDGGLQFNTNSYFSIIANARFFYNFGNNDHPETYYNDLAIGGGVKLNLAPRAVVNPFIFSEVNVNFLWFEDYYEFEQPYFDGYYWQYGDYSTNFATTLGLFAGGGFDFKFGSNFSIYLKTGPYFTMYDNRIDLYSQLGVRINLLKSKTI